MHGGLSVYAIYIAHISPGEVLDEFVSQGHLAPFLELRRLVPDSFTCS